MWFKIEDYEGLFSAEDVAEEICIYLDNNRWIIDEDVRSCIDELYPATVIGDSEFYASEILTKFDLLDDWFDEYVWINFKDHIIDTLKLTWENEEVEFLGEFLVTCIEE